MFMHMHGLVLTSAMLLVVNVLVVVFRKKSPSPGNASLVPSVRYNLLLPPVNLPPVHRQYMNRETRAKAKAISVNVIDIIGILNYSAHA